MSNLTKSQQEFVNSSSKFIRLLAPAGCGKTFSIIENLMNPVNFLDTTIVYHD